MKEIEFSTLAAEFWFCLIFDLCWKHRVLASVKFFAFYVCLFVCMFVCLYVCMYFWSGGESHVRLGGDVLHSTCKRCHSKTDGERQTRSIHAPFAWECTPRAIYVALCGTNQIEPTKLRVHFYQWKSWLESAYWSWRSDKVKLNGHVE